MSIFEAGLQLSISDFFYEVMRGYGFSKDDLTPNVVNKIVGFELACQALGVLPQFRAFQFFCNSSTQSGVHTFSQWRNTHAFVVKQRSPCITHRISAIFKFIYSFKFMSF